MSAADEGRTEQATQKQRDKFRNEGQVPRSVELNSLSQYLSGYFLFSLGGLFAIALLGSMMTQCFEQVALPGRDVLWGPLQQKLVLQTLLLLAPFLLVLWLAVVTINIAQFGLHFSTEPLTPKWSKLNFFANLKNILISSRALFELAKSSLKILVLGYLVWLVFRSAAEEFAMLGELTPWQIAATIWSYAEQIWIYFLAFMLAVGAADALYQRHQLNEKMKMAPHQIKDEHKQAEGDPKVKSRQRQKAAQFFRQVMAQNVRQAQVVITNPTHFAVALAYQPGTPGAPLVVARGADHLALRIRKLARQHQIPVVENRPLARGLYHQGRLGAEIPAHFFRPVAEILAWIFKLDRARRRA